MTDLTGKVFGRLTVLERAEDRRWKCRCTCGTIKFVTSSNFRKTTSCGCRKAEVNRAAAQQRSKSFDLTDKRFGRLVVTAKARTFKGDTYWLCRCDCGNEKTARRSHLTSGSTASCGCLWHAGSHGLSHTNEFQIWWAMRRRCNDRGQKGYINYGGRGISVCERWAIFENFLADMGRRPSVGHSIDRIDNDGNYEPSNCRWATQKVQSRNTRQNRIVTYCGERMTLTDAIEKSGSRLAKMTIIHRVNRGWSVELACSTPPRYQDQLNAVAMEMSA